MKLFLVKKLLVPAVHAFVAAAMLLTLSACASLETKPQTSSLPIETINGNTGSIASARAYRASDRLYVTGSSKAVFKGAHVDIQLIGSHGQVIAEKAGSTKTGYAHPRTARARHGNRSYVASFSLSEAEQASKIVVTYHYGSHESA